MENSKKLILFDFDGVLINTPELTYRLIREDNNHFTWERFKEVSHGNFIEGMVKLAREENYKLPQDFFEKYDKNLETISIHEILRSTILFLAKTYTLYVVSSSSASSIKKFLQQEKIENEFADILGMELHESKVVKIQHILEKEKKGPQDAVFVTDTLGDILEAGKCSVKSIGVTWGLHPEETLLQGHPAKIIDDPQELISAIEAVLG